MKKILFILSIFCCTIIYAQNEETIEIIDVEEVDGSSIEDVPFSIVEEVPVHPKCEDKATKSERKNCLNLMMRKHIQRHFNVGMVSCLEKELVLNKATGEKEEQCTSILSPGKKRIYVQFKIGKTGEIEDIQARAPHPKLKEEAIRVAGLLPIMKPGKQRGIPVRVGYTLPITFNVE